MTPKQIDLDMKLLAGEAIYVDDIPIEPMTLRDIARIGYADFQHSVNFISITLDDMIDSIDDFEIQATLKAERHNYKVFDLFIIFPEMRELLINSLKVLFEADEIEVMNEEFIDGIELVVDGKYSINRENFDEVAEVFVLQNNPNTSSSEEDEYNPANDLAESIAEKLKRSKEIVEKSKAMESNDEGITISDMISAVSAMSNSLNKLNIWDLTVYQLYDEFARLMKIDNYKLQIQASMWSSDMEIEHWSEPI